MTFANFALAGCVLLSMLSAAAQNRMPPIPKEKMTDAQKKTADEVAAGPRGAESKARRFVKSPAELVFMRLVALWRLFGHALKNQGSSRDEILDSAQTFTVSS